MERRRIQSIQRRRRAFVPSKWHIGFTEDGTREIFLSHDGVDMLRAPKESPIDPATGQRAGEIVVSGLFQIEYAVRTITGKHPERAGLTPWVDAMRARGQMYKDYLDGKLAIGKYGGIIAPREQPALAPLLNMPRPAGVGGVVRYRRRPTETQDGNTNSGGLVRRRRRNPD